MSCFSLNTSETSSFLLFTTPWSHAPSSSQDDEFVPVASWRSGTYEGCRRTYGCRSSVQTRFSHRQGLRLTSAQVRTVKFVLHSSEITSHSRGNLPFKRIVCEQDEPPTSSRLLLLLLQNLVFTIFFLSTTLISYSQRESVLSRQEHLDPRVWHALLLGGPCDDCDNHELRTTTIIQE